MAVSSIEFREISIDNDFGQRSYGYKLVLYWDHSNSFDFDHDSSLRFLYLCGRDRTWKTGQIKMALNIQLKVIG